MAATTLTSSPLAPSPSHGSTSADAWTVLHNLPKRKRTGEGFLVCCPAHEDNNPSLSIRREPSGQILVHCFGHCSTESVLGALGLRLSDLCSPQVPNTSTPSHNIMKPTFLTGGAPVFKDEEFREGDGQLVAIKRRVDYPNGTKSFIWYTPNGLLTKKPGLRSFGLSERDLPLYRLPELLAAPRSEPVILAEGGKACDALRAHGFVAVSLPGGADQKDFGAALDPLRGRRVQIWPDNDKAGVDFMRRVGDTLCNMGVDVRLLKPAGVTIPAKGDAFDYFAVGGTADNLRLMVEYAPTFPQSASIIATTGAESGSRVGSLVAVYDGGVGDEAALHTTGTRARSGESAEVQSLSWSSNRGTIGTSEGRGAAMKVLQVGAEVTPAQVRSSTQISNEHAENTSTTSELRGKWVKVWEVGEPPPREFVIAGLVPAGVVTSLYGDGGMGKSLIALLIAMLVCLGRDFAGRPVRKGPAIYLDGELDETEFVRRAYQVARGLGLSSPPENLHYYQLPAPLTDLAVQNEVRALVIHTRASFAVLDSLTMSTFDADQSDPRAVIKVIKYLEGLNSPVLAIDHIPKATPGVNMSHYTQFGSAFKRYAVRSQLQIVKAEGGAISLLHKKSNFGPLSDPISLAMECDDTKKSITFTQIDSDDERLAGIEDNLPAVEQTYRILATYPDGLKVPALAEELGKTEKTIKNHLTALKKSGRAESLGEGRWGAIKQSWSQSSIGSGPGPADEESIDDIPF